MQADVFNSRYHIGQAFVYHPDNALHDGYTVNTVDKAINLSRDITVVEINEAPYFANIKSLTAAQ